MTHFFWIDDDNFTKKAIPPGFFRYIDFLLSMHQEITQHSLPSYFNQEFGQIDRLTDEIICPGFKAVNPNIPVA
jgi:hypothetical protein